MALEEVAVLKNKNWKRLRCAIIVPLTFGVNVTAPSRFKDSLRIWAVILIILSWVTFYGLIQFIIRNSESFLTFAESLSLLLQTLISVIKFSYLIFTQRRFYGVVRKIESHELVEKIKILRYETPFNKELRKDVIQILDSCWSIALWQYNVYLSLCIAITSYYFFGAILVNAYHSYQGHTNHTNILPYPILFPFWENKMNQFPYYQILIITVGCGDYTAGIGAIAFDGLFVIMAMHGIALFRVLKKIIVFTTFPTVPKGLRVDYLRECILHFEGTYRFCAEVNKLFRHLGLVQFILSLAILGLVMYQAAQGLENDILRFLRMILYISAAGTQVFIYCLNGQLIANESDSIANSWYECNWYNESDEFKRLIQMMILRTNRVIYMQGSWFTTMSFATFLSIVKTSGSCFLLLRNLDL